MNTKYNLISKVTGQKFTQYKGDAIRLNMFSPYTVDEVVIGINGSKSNVKKITTFRDSSGKITERVFDYPNKPLKNRIYTQTDNSIGTDEYVESKMTKDYTIKRESIKYYKDIVRLSNKNKLLFWENKSTVTHHVSYNTDKDEIILTQVKIEDGKNPAIQKHSFIEYPRIKNGKKINTSPRTLTFEVNKDNNNVIKDSINGSTGIELPADDKYLGYRALSIEDAKIPFTKRFLKDRKMDDKDVKIVPDYNPRHYANPNFSAIFDAEDGSVKFNKDNDFYSKSKLANTSRHEVEHSWQYFIQGLLNGGGTNWQSDMAAKFGQIKDKKTLKEAKNYDKSIKTYVHFYENAERYRKNYIEIKAREKGRIEQDSYDFDGITIRKDFKHIPSKLL